MQPLIIIVVTLLVIAAVTALAPRLRVAAPLILVLLGVGISFVPAVPAITVDPEWIIAGILPPLLYAAAVSMPTMDFRRDFGAIRGLSVLLVIVTSVLMGLFFTAVIDGMSLWWGIALGAIVSPTDAVATAIARRAGVAGRTITVLQGESLLNDATALVMLRTAIASTAASVGFLHASATFLFSVAAASAIGYVVGVGNVWLRRRVTDSTVNTVFALTVPFVASLPAEAIGASGLVAAVVAGLVTGHRGPSQLSAQHRLSDRQVFATVELIAESAIFALMGLELFGIIDQVHDDRQAIGPAVAIAFAALTLTLLIRAVYVGPLLLALRIRTRRGVRVGARLRAFHERMSDRPDPGGENVTPRRRLDRVATRTRRALADIDYLAAAPMGPREGGILVWAGMRGAVTVAAAQTLPADTPDRALLVLIAFTVAAVSLLVQGGTLPLVVRALAPDTPSAQAVADERRRLRELIADASRSAGHPRSDSTPAERKRIALARIDAARAAVLAARDDGRFSSDALEHALTNLDADQIAIELKGGPPAE